MDDDNLKQIKTKFDVNQEKADKAIHEYEEVTGSTSNNEYLNNLLRRDIAVLDKKIHQDKEASATNDRQSYYENQATQTMLDYAQYVYYVYLGIGFIFLVVVFTSDQETTATRFIFLALLVIFTPPLLFRASSFVIDLVKRFVFMLPKDSYFSVEAAKPQSDDADDYGERKPQQETDPSNINVKEKGDFDFKVASLNAASYP